VPAAAKALLLKAVHLCCFLLAMSFKFFMSVGEKRIDKRLTGSGQAWGRGASQTVYGHSFKPLSHS